MSPTSEPRQGDRGEARAAGGLPAAAPVVLARVDGGRGRLAAAMTRVGAVAVAAIAVVALSMELAGTGGGTADTPSYGTDAAVTAPGTAAQRFPDGSAGPSSGTKEPLGSPDGPAKGPGAGPDSSNPDTGASPPGGSSGDGGAGGADAGGPGSADSGERGSSPGDSSGPGQATPDPSAPAPSAPGGPAPAPAPSPEPDPKPEPGPGPAQPAEPAPLEFRSLTGNGLIRLLGIVVGGDYTLTVAGEPGESVDVTYDGRTAGTVALGSSGTGSLTIGRSLLSLGLSNPAVGASYSDGSGEPISAPRNSI